MFEKVVKIEKLIIRPKVFKILLKPYKYLVIIISRLLNEVNSDFYYTTNSNLFFNQPIKILLPSSGDIFLFGLKTHDSEIRLTKYLIKKLKTTDVFIDIGAHIGYFSLLASQLIKTGQIHSIEASPSTYTLLKHNCRQHERITISNVGFDSKNKVGKFYEFPIKYSEYNCKEYKQFSKSKWFDSANILEYNIQYTTLDIYIDEKNIVPNIIKIDAEGSEYDILNGMRHLLNKNSNCTIIMEFINDDRSNDIYYKSAALLQEYSYQPHAIDNNGKLILIYSISDYLKKSNLDSDNLVFKKDSLFK